MILTPEQAYAVVRNLREPERTLTLLAAGPWLPSVNLVFSTHRVSFPLMPAWEIFHESRRSTRVPIKVIITVLAGDQSQTCDGETITVNIHGALIASTSELKRGMKIWIHVYLTDKGSLTTADK